MLLAHKIELRPSEEQEVYLLKLCGTYRHLWNNLLSQFKQENGLFSKKEAIRKMYLLRVEYPWYSDFSASILRCAINNLDAAYSRFFRERNGYPKFKSKYGKQGFNIYESEKFNVSGREFRFERFNKLKNTKPIMMRENIRFDGKVKQANVTYQNGKWYCSFLVEVQNYHTHANQSGIVGIDLGVKNLATLSNGVTYGKGNKLGNSLGRLKRIQKNLSKKVIGSNRYTKAKVPLIRLHARIKNQRVDYIHRVTDELTKTYKTIFLEDLSISSMVKSNRHQLNRMILDAGMYEFRRQMEYKSILRGVNLYFVDRYFPSSKLCNHCGHKNVNLKLGQSEWYCPDCGKLIDRDLNAAKNILDEGIRIKRG